MKTLHKLESLPAKLARVPIGLISRKVLWQSPAFEKWMAGSKTASARKKTVDVSVWMQLCSALTSLTSASPAKRAMARMWT